MWGKHHRIIKKYRKSLTQFQDEHGKKRPVELRKQQDAFVAFIKQITRFYRSFIQRLVSHFQMKDLEWVISKFHLSGTPTPAIHMCVRSHDDSVSTPDSVMECDSETREHVIRSCHRTLVFLGDLSRYREVPKQPKNWAPATGYYTLAKKLIPSSGTPYNQLAVIALNEGSTLSATYHLYRAISVSEPFPEASDNLEIGFRKAIKTFKSEASAPNYVRKEEQVVKDLITLFVRLHAKCYAAQEFGSPPNPTT